jgi:hypothetical protein
MTVKVSMQAQTQAQDRVRQKFARRGQDFTRGEVDVPLVVMLKSSLKMRQSRSVILSSGFCDQCRSRKSRSERVSAEIFFSVS